MTNILKVSVLEDNGEELPVASEAFLSIQNIHNETPLRSDAQGASLLDVLTWLRKNTLYRREFTENEIIVPSGHVKQMHSPKIDGELVIDGEVYIL